MPAALVSKPQTALTDTKASDELTGLRTRSPAEPKDGPDSVVVDKKVATAKPKVTRQRMTEIGKLPKSIIGRVKPVGSAAGLSKKTTSTVDDKTEKKPPGRPPGASKTEEKIAKKKVLGEKKSAVSGHADIKRTGSYVLVEKVDSNKEDKSSVQKRVGVYCCGVCIFVTGNGLTGLLGSHLIYDSVLLCFCCLFSVFPTVNDSITGLYNAVKEQYTCICILINVISSSLENCIL